MYQREHNSKRTIHTPLASMKWLKYLGVVLLFICIYVVAKFYYRYEDDVIPKSLTLDQHLTLSIYALGTIMPKLFAPLLFFSTALLYRKVRVKDLNPIKAMKRDLFILIPLGFIVWTYMAYCDEPVSRKFASMMWTVQEMKPGEKYEENQYTYELMRSPNLNGLYAKLDSWTKELKFGKTKLKMNWRVILYHQIMLSL